MEEISIRKNDFNAFLETVDVINLKNTFLNSKTHAKDLGFSTENEQILYATNFLLLDKGVEWIIPGGKYFFSASTVIEFVQKTDVFAKNPFSGRYTDLNEKQQENLHELKISPQSYDMYQRDFQEKFFAHKKLFDQVASSFSSVKNLKENILTTSSFYITHALNSESSLYSVKAINKQKESSWVNEKGRESLEKTIRNNVKVSREVLLSIGKSLDVVFKTQERVERGALNILKGGWDTLVNKYFPPNTNSLVLNVDPKKNNFFAEDGNFILEKKEFFLLKAKKMADIKLGKRIEPDLDKSLFIKPFIYDMRQVSSELYKKEVRENLLLLAMCKGYSPQAIQTAFKDYVSQPYTLDEMSRMAFSVNNFLRKPTIGDEDVTLIFLENEKNKKVIENQKKIFARYLEDNNSENKKDLSIQKKYFQQFISDHVKEPEKIYQELTNKNELQLKQLEQLKIDASKKDEFRERVHSFQMVGHVIAKGFELGENYKISNDISVAVDSFAQLASGLSEISTATGFGILNSLSMIVGGIFGFVSLFSGKKKDKSAEILLNAIKQIAQMISKFREEMHERFDRIEKQIYYVHKDMIENFEKISKDINHIYAIANAVHKKLDLIQKENYQYYKALSSREVREIQNLFLDYEMSGHFDFDEEFMTNYRKGLLTFAMQAKSSSYEATNTGEGKNINSSIFSASGMIMPLRDYYIQHADTFRVPEKLPNPAMLFEGLSDYLKWRLIVKKAHPLELGHIIQMYAAQKDLYIFFNAIRQDKKFLSTLVKNCIDTIDNIKKNIELSYSEQIKKMKNNLDSRIDTWIDIIDKLPNTYKESCYHRKYSVPFCISEFFSGYYRGNPFDDYPLLESNSLDGFENKEKFFEAVGHSKICTPWLLAQLAHDDQRPRGYFQHFGSYYTRNYNQKEPYKGVLKLSQEQAHGILDKILDENIPEYIPSAVCSTAIDKNHETFDLYKNFPFLLPTSHYKDIPGEYFIAELLGVGTLKYEFKSRRRSGRINLFLNEPIGFYDWIYEGGISTQFFDTWMERTNTPIRRAAFVDGEVFVSFCPNKAFYANEESCTFISKKEKMVEDSYDHNTHRLTDIPFHGIGFLRENKPEHLTIQRVAPTPDGVFRELIPENERKAFFEQIKKKIPEMRLYHYQQIAKNLKNNEALKESLSQFNDLVRILHSYLYLVHHQNEPIYFSFLRNGENILNINLIVDNLKNGNIYSFIDECKGIFNTINNIILQDSLLKKNPIGYFSKYHIEKFIEENYFNNLRELFEEGKYFSAIKQITSFKLKISHIKDGREITNDFIGTIFSNWPPELLYKIAMALPIQLEEERDKFKDVYQDCLDLTTRHSLNWILSEASNGRYYMIHSGYTIPIIEYLQKNPDLKILHLSIRNLNENDLWEIMQAVKQHAQQLEHFYVEPCLGETPIDLLPAVKAGLFSPSENFEKRFAESNVRALQIYDENYYKEHYKEFISLEENPLVNFLKEGQFKKRNPSLFFDSNYYETKHRDVTENWVNQDPEKNSPIYHFMHHGQYEGRDPSAFFNTHYYKNLYSDAKQWVEKRPKENSYFQHAMRIGIREKRETYEKKSIINTVAEENKITEFFTQEKLKPILSVVEKFKENLTITYLPNSTIELCDTEGKNVQGSVRSKEGKITVCIAEGNNSSVKNTVIHELTHLAVRKIYPNVEDFPKTYLDAINEIASNSEGLPDILKEVFEKYSGDARYYEIFPRIAELIAADKISELTSEKTKKMYTFYETFLTQCENFSPTICNVIDMNGQSFSCHHEKDFFDTRINPELGWKETTSEPSKKEEQPKYRSQKSNTYYHKQAEIFRQEQLISQAIQIIPLSVPWVSKKLGDLRDSLDERLYKDESEVLKQYRMLAKALVENYMYRDAEYIKTLKDEEKLLLRNMWQWGFVPKSSKKNNATKFSLDDLKEALYRKEYNALVYYSKELLRQEYREDAYAQLFFMIHDASEENQTLSFRQVIDLCISHEAREMLLGLRDDFKAIQVLKLLPTEMRQQLILWAEKLYRSLKKQPIHTLISQTVEDKNINVQGIFKKKSHLNEIRNTNRDSYVRHEIASDGDCGYTAFGITREKAFDLLNQNIKKIRDVATPAIKHALLLTEFLDFLKEKALVSKNTTLESIESNMDHYARDLDIIKGYIEYDVQKKKIDAGWAHPTVLQALAEIQGVELRIWQLDEKQALVPHAQTEYAVYKPSQETKASIDLLFVNGNHFERLEFKNKKVNDDLLKFYTNTPSTLFFKSGFSNIESQQVENLIDRKAGCGTISMNSL